MRRTLACAALCAGLLMLDLQVAAASRLFVNGNEVPMGALRNQDFTEVDEVWFDAEGNVHVIAPRYNIRIRRPDGAEADLTSEAALQRFLGQEVWLIFLNPDAWAVPYHIKIFINDEEVALFRPDQEQVTINVTRHLRLGRNTLQIEARRGGGGGGDASTLSDANLQILLAHAEEEDGRLQIRRNYVNHEIPRSEERSRFIEEMNFDVQRTRR